MQTIKLLFAILLFHSICNAQDVISTKARTKFIPESNINLENIDESRIYTKSFEQDNKRFRNETFEVRFYKARIREEESFDLMSSVGSNINFGGFWDKYAIINFTPQMNIKPLSFINIYASHNLNCLIPINGIKEYYQSVLIQSMAILAVDKSFDLIMNPSSWITDVISFAAKNLVINLLIKPSIDNSSKTGKPILQFENFYYSMRITF